MIPSLIQIFSRDLNKLRDEIISYKNQDSLWEIDGDISNSAGNLCLHLIGNLNWFIGEQLGDTGYVRNREKEFSVVEVDQKELIEKIDETRITVINVLSNLDEEDLEETFPLEVFGEPMTTGFFLVHLTTHLAYHLGQINYHRRLLDV
ncbi:MAG: DinB family protein [Crocinitomicaceae bacterium]|nr:DinB family protein [Crocinitomicaceae bacterium]